MNGRKGRRKERREEGKEEGKKGERIGGLIAQEAASGTFVSFGCTARHVGS